MPVGDTKEFRSQNPEEGFAFGSVVPIKAPERSEIISLLAPGY